MKHGKIYTDVIQGEAAWFDCKRGKIGATSLNDIMSKGRGGCQSAGSKNLMAKLAVERLTGLTAETYSNGAMQWGVENEALARAAYEFVNDVEVVQVGFVDHPFIGFAGMSPDGLVGDDGLVEIKCPNTATHIDYLRAKAVPSEYVKQVQWQMACSGRLWCDFMSFDPRMPQRLQSFIVRVWRDEHLIDEMQTAAHMFLIEVTALVTEIEELEL